jgi:hypothetical protein
MSKESHKTASDKLKPTSKEVDFAAIKQQNDVKKKMIHSNETVKK